MFFRLIKYTFVTITILLVISFLFSKSQDYVYYDDATPLTESELKDLVGKTLILINNEESLIYKFLESSIVRLGEGPVYIRVYKKDGANYLVDDDDNDDDLSRLSRVFKSDDSFFITNSFGGVMREGEYKVIDQQEQDEWNNFKFFMLAKKYNLNFDKLDALIIHVKNKLNDHEISLSKNDIIKHLKTALSRINKVEKEHVLHILAHLMNMSIDYDKSIFKIQEMLKIVTKGLNNPAKADAILSITNRDRLDGLDL
jgi:hypothetical protein